MPERDWEILKPKEMSNAEAALKLTGEVAKKTVTLIFKTIKDNPVTHLGVGMVTGGIVLAGIYEIKPAEWLILVGAAGTLVGFRAEEVERYYTGRRISIPQEASKKTNSLKRKWSSYKRGNSSLLPPQ